AARRLRRRIRPGLRAVLPVRSHRVRVARVVRAAAVRPFVVAPSRPCYARAALALAFSGAVGMKAKTWARWAALGGLWAIVAACDSEPPPREVPLARVEDEVIAVVCDRMFSCDCPSG